MKLSSALFYLGLLLGAPGIGVSAMAALADAPAGEKMVPAQSPEDLMADLTADAPDPSRAASGAQTQAQTQTGAERKTQTAPRPHTGGPAVDPADAPPLSPPLSPPMPLIRSSPVTVQQRLGAANRALTGQIADLGRLIALQGAMKADLLARTPAGSAPALSRARQQTGPGPGRSAPARDSRLAPALCSPLLLGDLCDDLSGTFRVR